MRCRAASFFTALLVVAVSTIGSADLRADITWAGDHLVDLDATALTLGSIETWTNAGTLGDFVAAGAPQVQAVDGANAVMFDGVNDYFDGPLSVASIELNEDFSVEVWAQNPWVANEETLLAWGKRGGPDGTNMSFNYGTSTDFGAVGHWGSSDIGWNGAPTRNQWHHLAYTYDGSTQRVYADGLEANFEDLPGGLAIAPSLPIRLATQTDGDGITATGGLRGSLSLGKVRIHSGLLSADDILNNYNTEKEMFPVDPIVPPTAEQLPTGPVHRYSFASDASDSVGGADGELLNNTGNATYADGKLILGNDGAQSSNANNGDYVNLPNGIISSLINNGTFETWTTWNGPADSSWQRIFDFGTSNDGEDQSPAADQQSYVMLTPRSGSNTLRAGYRYGATAEERVVEDSQPLAQGEQKHVAVVWNGDEETISLFLDGELVAENQTHLALSDLVDNNNWLGRAQWNDPMYVGDYDEFRIYDYPLTANQILGNFEAGADTVNVVPEPSSLALLALGLTALFLRRRK